MAPLRRNKRKSAKRSPARASAGRTQPLRAVIFDIGRVIVRLDPKRALAPIIHATPPLPRRSAKRLSAEDTWKLICADEHWQDWQEGKLSPAKWHQHLMRRLNLSLSFGEFRDAWNHVLDPDLILPEELFIRLGSRCRLALLSNTDPIHAACLEQRFGFICHFPVRIYSCEVSATKPSPAIFQAALIGLRVAAREAVYIDDIKEFVDAARKLGLDAIHFRTPQLLESELQSRHLC